MCFGSRGERATQESAGYGFYDWPFYAAARGIYRDVASAWVRCVVDVRSIPRSRHNPQFNRETLARRLRSAGIGYVHLKKLGGLRHAKADSANRGWHNSSFRGFADYMQTEEFLTGLARLEKLAAGKPTAIMCAEAVPWRCHRSLIADALLVRDFPVEDIMSVARAQEHELTPFARVRGLRITYPTDKPAKS
jgi:uncharacterized protein (DUF488 family)